MTTHRCTAFVNPWLHDANWLHVQFPTASMIPGRDFDYFDLMQSAGKHDCVPIPAMEPLYLMHTSGTTGTPKVCRCRLYIKNESITVLPLFIIRIEQQLETTSTGFI